MMAFGVSALDIDAIVSISLNIYKTFSLVGAQTDSAREYRKFAEESEKLRESLAKMSLDCGDDPYSFDNYDMPDSYHCDAPPWSSLDTRALSYRHGDIPPMSILQCWAWPGPSSSVRRPLGSPSFGGLTLGGPSSSCITSPSHQSEDVGFLAGLGVHSMDSQFNPGVLEDQMGMLHCTYRLPTRIELNFTSNPTVDIVLVHGLRRDSASNNICGFVAARKTFTRPNDVIRHMRYQHQAVEDSSRRRRAEQKGCRKCQQEHARCSKKLRTSLTDRRFWFCSHCAAGENPNSHIQEHSCEVKDSGQVFLIQLRQHIYANIEQILASRHRTSSILSAVQDSKQVCIV